jgi:hypothetical protein
MVKKLKQRWQVSRVRPGDGSALKDYRSWQLFSRSLYFLELADPPGDGHVFAVDVRHLADAKTKKQHQDAVGRSPAALYRDGAQVYRANLPTTFPVPGGVIEVATSATGLKRMHYVSDDGREYQLRPHRRSQEGLRARFDQRFPRASAVIGVTSLVVLVTALVVGLMTAAEALTRSPAVAEQVGTFTSPVSLPTWAKVALVVVGLLAAAERALRLRHHWLIDGAAA